MATHLRIGGRVSSRASSARRALRRAASPTPRRAIRTRAHSARTRRLPPQYRHRPATHHQLVRNFHRIAVGASVPDAVSQFPIHPSPHGVRFIGGLDIRAMSGNEGRDHANRNISAQPGTLSASQVHPESNLHASGMDQGDAGAGIVPYAADVDVFEYHETPINRNFNDFTQALFHQDLQLENLVTTAIIHPAGLPYYRLITTVAEGQRQALFRADVENINVDMRLQILRTVVQRVAPAQIHWENLLLLWNSYLPDSESADIGRIRQLAIDLQNLDVSGQWDYARLRQRVHNFPEASLILDLEQELTKAREALTALPEGPASTPERTLQQERVRLLAELHVLEKAFWEGTGLSAEWVRANLEVLGFGEEIPNLVYGDSDPCFRKVEALLAIRTELRHSVATPGGRRVAELMRSTEPLTPIEAHTLFYSLSLDRKLAQETSRLMAQIGRGELLGNSAESLKMMARLLELDGLLSAQRAEEICRLAGNVNANIGGIRKIFAQAIGDVQGRFAAMRTHLDGLAPNLPTGQNNNIQAMVGAPRRAVLLGDNEIRQSLLFSVGIHVQTIAQTAQPPLDLSLDGKIHESCTDVDRIFPLKQPVTGKVMFVRNEEDLSRVTRAVHAGSNVILVKTAHYDIDLPAVGLLITLDPALNEASHMALLARSAGIAHFNIVKDRSALLDYLARQEGKEIQFSGDPANPQSVQVQTLTDPATRDQSSKASHSLPEDIDESYSDPVRLEDMLALEEKLGRKLSGGKGRGLAILQAVQPSTGDSKASLPIPSSVQIPYGFFMDWLRQVHLLEPWQEALSSRSISANWDVVDRIRRAPIPGPVMDKLVAMLGGVEGLQLGWFVRSNSNSEDGGFNAAGVNKTLEDVRDQDRLEEAVKEVFLATYGPRARTWWHRTYRNPEAVRSTVFLVQTVLATDASVALVGSDGARFSVDSLPGVGQNVVGGAGTAERLLYSTGGDGRVNQISMVQPAAAYKLKVWEGVENPDSRKIVERSLIYQGPVLSPTQRKNVAELVKRVRSDADQHPNFKDKPLDLEIAWDEDAPYLVQIRVAPSEPDRMETVASDPSLQARPPRSLHSISTERLFESALAELESDRPLHMALQLKMSQLVGQVRLEEGEASAVAERFRALGGERLVARIEERAAALPAQVCQGLITSSEALVQARSLQQMHALMRLDARRSEWEWQTHAVVLPNSQIGRGMMNVLTGALEADRLPEIVQIQLIELTQRVLTGRWDSHRDPQPETLQALLAPLLPIAALKRLIEGIERFSANNREMQDWIAGVARCELKRLVPVIADAEPEEARAAFERARQIVEISPVADARWIRRATLEAASAKLRMTHQFFSFDSMWDRTRSGLWGNMGLVTDRYGNLRNEDQDALKLFQGGWERLRAVLNAGERYQDLILDEERAKAPADRSLENLASILGVNAGNAKSPREAARTNAVLELFNEMGVVAEITATTDFTFTVRLRHGNSSCSFGFSEALPIFLVSRLQNFSFDFSQVPVSANRNNQVHSRYTDLREGDLPQIADLTENPMRLMFLFSYLLRAAERSAESQAKVRIQVEEVRKLAAQALERLAQPGAQKLNMESWRALASLFVFSIQARNQTVRDLVSPLGRLLTENMPVDFLGRRYRSESAHMGDWIVREQMDVLFPSRESSGSQPFMQIVLINNTFNGVQELEIRIGPMIQPIPMTQQTTPFFFDKLSLTAESASLVKFIDTLTNGWLSRLYGHDEESQGMVTRILP